jgi:hypothetical protein
MAVAISPSNAGVIYDPRLNAVANWLSAVEKDLNQQARERNPSGYRRGTPMPSNLFLGDPSTGQAAAPNPALKGFSAGRQFGIAGVLGTIGGGVVRIG